MSKSERDAAALSVETFICQYCLQELNGTVGGVKLSVFSSNNNNSNSSSGNGSSNSSQIVNSLSSPNWRSKKTQSQLNAAVEEQELSPEEELAKILSIQETPDRPILNQEPFQRIIQNATESLEKSGFKLLLFPDPNQDRKSLTTMMNMTFAEMEDQIMESSRSSIEDATFSEEYPLYCIRELQSKKHPYLQGAAAWCTQRRKIVAVVMSNGRDPYCDLRTTVSNLKNQVAAGKVKLLVTPQEESQYVKEFNRNQNSRSDNNNNNNTKSATKLTTTLNMSSSASNGTPRIRQRTSDNQISSTPSTAPIPSSCCITSSSSTSSNSSILMRGSAANFAKQCLEFRDFDSVVHFTYIVTHEDYRGKKLAKTLMWIELARWALRGRSHACVNMALEKIYHHQSEELLTNQKHFIIDDDDDGDEVAEGGEVKTGHDRMSHHDHHHHDHRHPSSSPILGGAPRKLNSETAAAVPSPSTSPVTTATTRTMSSTKKVNSSVARTASRTTKATSSSLAELKNNNTKASDSEDDGVEDTEPILECRVTEASRRLYNGLTFSEVFPRYDGEGNLRWTRKEENAGRMMLSIDFPMAILLKKVSCPFL